MRLLWVSTQRRRLHFIVCLFAYPYKTAVAKCLPCLCAFGACVCVCVSRKMRSCACGHAFRLFTFQVSPAMKQVTPCPWPRKHTHTRARAYVHTLVHTLVHTQRSEEIVMHRDTHSHRHGHVADGRIFSPRKHLLFLQVFFCWSRFHTAPSYTHTHTHTHTHAHSHAHLSS